MGAVYVYEGNAEDTLDIGLVGELMPTECIFEEIRNGMSQITMTHPMDPYGKWKALKTGRLLKAPVPVRTTPEIIMDDQDAPVRVTITETWRIKPAAAKEDRCLYKKATGSKKGKKLVPLGSKVVVVQMKENRYKCKTKVGTGWVNIAGLEYVLSNPALPDTNAGIETVADVVKVVDQLFRIVKVEEGIDSVDVTARHIFYDLHNVTTTFKEAGATSAGAALKGISDGAVMPHEFEFYTDTADTRSALQWVRLPIDKALLDPDEGLAARWNLMLVRDDYEVYLLRSLNTDRGAVIEYGSNMLDITMCYDDSATVTRLMPIGEDKKGNAILLPEKFVDSPKIGDYPVIRQDVLDCRSTCSMKNGLTLAQVYAEMRRLAALEFSENHIDDVKLSATVRFVNLGDTEEFPQYRGLDRAYTYDTVTFIREDAGINLKADVQRMKWDVIGGPDGEGRILEIDVSNVRKGSASRRIPSWQLQGGIDGTKLKDQSVGSSAIADGAVTDQQLADEAVTGPKIANLAIGTAHIQLAAITQALIAELAVGTAQIADAAITQAKINTAEINWASIANLAADIANIAKAQITAANIEAANIDWAHIGTLAADVANIAKGALYDADIQWADIENLQAAVAQIVSAQIVSAEIDFAKIMDLEAQSAIFRAGVAGEMYIDRLAITSAAMLSATLGELVIKGDDGKYYQITVQADGTIGTTEVTVTEGEIAAGQTSTGRQIVETELDVQALNAQTIKAASAIIGEITTTALSAGKITAAQAMLAAATIPQLMTDAINAIGDKMTFAANSVIQMLLGVAGEIGKWFTFSNTEGLLIRKPAYTDEHGVEHPASIWSTQTDETGYHIRRSDMADPVGSFARDRLMVDGVQIGDIVARKTGTGGWVWTDA